jgi:hypothetical protein
VWLREHKVNENGNYITRKPRATGLEISNTGRSAGVRPNQPIQDEYRTAKAGARREISPEATFVIRYAPAKKTDRAAIPAITAEYFIRSFWTKAV